MFILEKCSLLLEKQHRPLWIAQLCFIVEPNLFFIICAYAVGKKARGCSHMRQNINLEREEERKLTPRPF